MKRALERHERGEARVIPVILHPCLWQTTPLYKLQALPANGKPVTNWKRTRDGFANMAEGVQKVVQTLLAQPVDGKKESFASRLTYNNEPSSQLLSSAETKLDKETERKSTTEADGENQRVQVIGSGDRVEVEPPSIAVPSGIPPESVQTAPIVSTVEEKRQEATRTLLKPAPVDVPLRPASTSSPDLLVQSPKPAIPKQSVEPLPLRVVSLLRNTTHRAYSTLSIGKVTVLIALVLLIVGSTLLLYSTETASNSKIQATSTATNRANEASATAQIKATFTVFAQEMSANATATVNAFATANASVIATNPDPYPPGGGRLAFYDPLNDNNNINQWDKGSTCFFMNGAYHIKTSDPFHAFPCLSNSPDFSNFVYEVHMTIIKGSTGGMIFRAVDGNDYYVFYVGQGGSFGIYFCRANSCGSVLDSGYSVVIKRGLNQTNTIAVVAKGNIITLYANHRQIDSINDSTFSHGEIGLIAFDDPESNSGHPTEVKYSNVKVWTL